MKLRRILTHRYTALLALALVTSFAFGTALADKPATVLEGPTPTIVTAIPIDFDRDNPRRKEFGKLIFRSGLNLFAKSRHFGGYSGLAIDPSSRAILAISDAGTWMRATLDYDGRRLKGLNDVVLGPLLGANGKPLRDDSDRDSESIALVDGARSRRCGEGRAAAARQGDRLPDSRQG